MSALLRGIAGNNNGDFYCLTCFRSYTTENKLEKHKNVCEKHDYGYVEIPKEDNKILKYNHGEKSMKAPFVIYADLECLLEKMSTCHNNPEKSSTTKINKHTPSGYSLFTCCSLDTTENKLDYYQGKKCIKNFCLNLREHLTKIINYEKKEIIPLTKKEEKRHNKQKFCHICKKKFSNDDNNGIALNGVALSGVALNKEYHKVKDHCHYTGKYRGAAHSICYYIKHQKKFLQYSIMVLHMIIIF